MAYPPVIPPNNRTDATDMVTVHASDHNAIADALSAIVAQMDVTPWAPLTLLSPWSNFGSGYATAQYRRIGGALDVMGTIVGSGTPAVGTPIAVIPAGFRPSVNHFMGTLAFGGLARIDYLVSNTSLVWQGPQTTGATAGLVQLTLRIPL